MKVWRKIKNIFVSGLILTLLFGQNIQAEDRPSYTYQITLSTGNCGTFSGTEGIQVVSGKQAPAYKISQPEEGGTKIRISGLSYGDRVILDAQSGMIRLSEPDRYYIRGIRESGRDNNTVGNSSILIESDRDYVVAYAMKGNMVSYIVNYQDEAGKELAKSRTCYGMVGDKPIVAFSYIDGYTPQAYNLTKTLQNNEKENVFTFVYRKNVQPAETKPTGTGSSSGTGTSQSTGSTSGTGSSSGTGGSSGTGSSSGTGGSSGTGTSQSTPTNPADQEENQNAENGDQQNAPDQESVQENTESEAETSLAESEPQELVELDTEAVPLASGQNNKKAEGRPMSTVIVFGVIAACALAGFIVLLFLLRHKKEK